MNDVPAESADTGKGSVEPPSGYIEPGNGESERGYGHPSPRRSGPGKGNRNGQKEGVLSRAASGRQGGTDDLS